MLEVVTARSLEQVEGSGSIDPLMNMLLRIGITGGKAECGRAISKSVTMILGYIRLSSTIKA